MALPVNGQMEARRAVEALRSGVPSSAAVLKMGTGQESLAHRFRRLLDTAQEEANQGRQGPGFLVRAGFGEGKSHLLTAFEHIAINEGYGVSRVVISKETPLYAPAKVLATAVENLRVPRAVTRGLDEVGVLLGKRFETPEFRNLAERLSLVGLNARFALTLQILREGSQDEGVVDRVLRFWAGELFEVAQMKRSAREIGISDFRPETIKANDLALQTCTFLPLLLNASGLRGWVVLLDELELIGRYGKVSRGRAYAELARWTGARQDEQRPYLVTVGAITSDFERDVLLEKGDLDMMGPHLASRQPDVSQECERGMQLIREAELLAAPDHDLLQRSYDILKNLHGVAYNWTPRDVAWPEMLGATPMRTFVRAWINAWDVLRLYNTQTPEDGFEIDRPKSSYNEIPGLDQDEPEG